MAQNLDFHAIKSQYPIEKVIELLGLDLTRQKNGQYRGPCPIHGGNEPRGFVVTPSTAAKGANLFYCFKEELGGDQLALIAKVRKISVLQAAEWLVGDLGGTSAPKRASRPETSSEGSSFSELTYLEPDHEAVIATGLDPEIAALIGAGYAVRGTMKGNVLVPLRLKNGFLVGYVGIEEIIAPPRWHLPDQKLGKLLLCH